MYWRRGGIKVLPYLDDFYFPKSGYHECVRLARRVEADFYKAGLLVNFPKSGRVPAKVRRHLGFEVDLEAGVFRVPEDRWEALQSSADALLHARGRRVQARQIAKFTGTVISIHKVGLGPGVSAVHAPLVCHHWRSGFAQLLGLSHGGGCGRASILAALA